MRATALLALAAAAAATSAVIGNHGAPYGLITRALARKGAALRDKIAGGELNDATISTPYGSLSCVDDGAVQQCLGVPFAQPPVGPLRWKAPVEVQPWGSRNATWFGPTCPQHSHTWDILTGQSEDCLYANIFVPSPKSHTPPAGGWPVMLFFYGGSWDEGGAGFPLYDGWFDLDVNSTENKNPVMLVTVNYRLNVFGFLASDALRADGPDGSVGNYGLQDQREAMRFLGKVASSFGGNPNRLTIFGESAGAGSVSNHLVSPRSFGLFQQAAMESGPFADWTAIPFNITAPRWNIVAGNAGCGGQSGAAQVACMRALTWEQLLEANKGIASNILEWAPVIDGVEVVGVPRDLAANGAIAPGVPVLLGSNADEGTGFVPGDVKYDVNASQYLPALTQAVGAKLAALVVNEYPPADYSGPSASPVWWAASHAIGDGAMSCAARRTARQLSSASRNGGAAPVYLYFFAHEWFALHIADLFRPLGVCHGSELIGVFGIQLLGLGFGEDILMQQMIRYWMRFGWYGNPNGDGTSGDYVWPSYTAATDAIVVLDTGAGGLNITTAQGLKKQQCDFWDANPIDPAIIFVGPNAGAGSAQ